MRIQSIQYMGTKMLITDILDDGDYRLVPTLDHPEMRVTIQGGVLVRLFDLTNQAEYRPPWHRQSDGVRIPTRSRRSQKIVALWDRAVARSLNLNHWRIEKC